MLVRHIQRARRKRDTGTMLLEQVQDYIGSECCITLTKEKSWASITFSGMRYMFEIVGINPDGKNISAQQFEKLANHEFDLPGQFVADILIREKDSKNAALKVEILAIVDPVSE
ncbi:MAG: hypothetical protein ABJN65_16200 [Parasphingorhabdus sp.]